jgi:hypothetical protein
MGEDQRLGLDGELEKLARDRFRHLSAAEVKLLRAAQGGEWAFCGPSESGDDPRNDPSKADQEWGSSRQIRAVLISWLCVDRRARDQVTPIGIWVHAAKLTGGLSLEYAAVPFPLSFLNCRLTDAAFFLSAEVPELSFQGSWVQMLGLQRARVRGSIFLRNRFRAEGEVQLQNVEIAGFLDCSGGIFMNPPRKGVSNSGTALAADGITVNGNLFLNSGFHSEGAVRLLNAQIGGDLDCAGGRFINPSTKELSGSGIALSAVSMTVKGDLLLSSGFHSEGAVDLSNAQIDGNLNCSGGTFVNPPIKDLSSSGTALQASTVMVKRNAQFSDDFRAEGRVDLTVTRIGDDLVFRNGSFKAATLDLRDASSKSILDDDRAWPERGKLYLDGFVYGRIAEGRTDAETRLKWLNLQPERPFARQPYLQLAKVLRDTGDDPGARRVLVAMEDRQWEVNRQWTDPFLRWPLRATVGYGYRPLWAFWEVLGLSALGWIVYRRGYLAGNVVPTDRDAYQSFKADGQPPAHYSAFAPLIYSVENSLPLVKLGQTDRWQPDPKLENLVLQERGLTTRLGRQRLWPRCLKGLRSALVLCGLERDLNPVRPRSRLSRVGTSARSLRWFLWIQILLGWLLATLFVAGVTGIVRTQ